MSAKSYQLKPGKYANVEVEKSGDFTNVWLHGNLVACHDQANNTLTVSSAGWHTPTTRTTINRALTLFGFEGWAAIEKRVLTLFTPDHKPIPLYRSVTLNRAGQVLDPDLAA